MALGAPLLKPLTPESVDIAALSTGAAAAAYNPISGLITDTLGNPKGGEIIAPPHFAGGTAQSVFGAPGTAPGAPTGQMGQPIMGGAYTPDWKALIEGDPGLIGAKGAISAGDTSSLAGRDAAIQNAYVQFGGQVDIPSLAKQLGMSEADVQASLGADAQRLAQENTSAGLSTQARLQQANQQATMRLRAELNRRGMLRSGEAGYQIDQENLGYRQAQSDATQKLLGYLQQYQQGYLAAHQQGQNQLAQAYSDAANRQFANNQGSPGTEATLDHVDANGNAVYRAADGTLYAADGSLYVMPNQPAPAGPVAAPAAAPAQAPGVANAGLPTGGGVVGPSPFMAPLPLTSLTEGMGSRTHLGAF